MAWSMLKEQQLQQLLQEKAKALEGEQHLLYREFQGEGCGQKHGYVWAFKDARVVDKDPVSFLKADAHPDKDHTEALKEAAEVHGVDPKSIKVVGVN